MKIFGARISGKVQVFLNDNLLNIKSYEVANQLMIATCGITHFFESDEDVEILKQTISGTNSLSADVPCRTGYGDFQTTSDLADKVTLHLSSKNISPEIVIEPTCGQGNFIIASLKTFTKIKNIIAIEIYKPYVYETKFKILNYFLSTYHKNKPEIAIYSYSIFDFDFNEIAGIFSDRSVLIIGNPPWVTNSESGCLNSSNLPNKSNFKNHSNDGER
jgi:hypothetical protein